MRILIVSHELSFEFGLALIFLAACYTGLPVSAAQNAPAKTPAATGSSSPMGFSIETEMLTYRSLESNSEAIACDIAAYLNGTAANFTNPPPGAVCGITGGGSPKAFGVVMLPFDRSVISEFELWRSDIQMMRAFQQGVTCTAPNPVSSAAPAVGTSAPDTRRGGGTGPLMALTPAGAIAGTATELLGLFATDHTASPVGGTVQDQALIDETSRELRALSVEVLMPTVYTPYALTSIQADHSPFLIALKKLIETRDCLSATKGSDDPNLKDINNFLTSLSRPVSPAKPETTPAASPSPTSPPASPTLLEETVNMTHLDSVLWADGLAQRLGADPATGVIPDNAPQHLLFVKALESGGSVLRSSSIFGSKISYSGGSVASYVLFNLNGEVECSGNVYEYAGSIPSKQFHEKLREYRPDPATQVIFQRGGCRQ